MYVGFSRLLKRERPDHIQQDQHPSPCDPGDAVVGWKETSAETSRLPTGPATSAERTANEVHPPFIIAIVDFHRFSAPFTQSYEPGPDILRSRPGSARCFLKYSYSLRDGSHYPCLLTVLLLPLLLSQPCLTTPHSCSGRWTMPFTRRGPFPIVGPLPIYDVVCSAHGLVKSRTMRFSLL